MCAHGGEDSGPPARVPTRYPPLGLHQVVLCIVGTLVAAAVIVARRRTFLEPRCFALGVVGIVLSINNTSLLTTRATILATTATTSP